MKTVTIKKSKKKSRSYLILSCVLLSFFIYLFLTDKTEYPKGKSFYWVAIILFGTTSVFFLYDYLDNSPLYILNNTGVCNGKGEELAVWNNLSLFKCESPYQKYITPKFATLYDKFGSEVLTLDFTHSDISLDKMTRILKKKLREK
jgi:hypothetical protein